MKPTTLRELLRSRRLRLSKSLGQNFLHDDNQVRRILQLAEVRPENRILEIGPGLGALTSPLVRQGAKVLAIEKDRRLVELLKEQEPMKSAPNLTLLTEDALRFLQESRIDWTQWKLVANLPYSVASPILVELAQGATAPQRMVATLQWEVAERLRAPSGSKDYGILTLLIQVRYDVVDWLKIPAGCFFPEPEVDSACLLLERRARPLVPPSRLPRFAELVKQSFAQRRKTVWKLLKSHWPQESLERGFKEARIPPDARAEAVSLDQFVTLAERLF